MHQKEDLVARAGPAIADPNARRVLLSLLAMYGEAGVVGAVNKVTQALKIEHAAAASLRYGATLARDFPEAFQQLIQNDKSESEKTMPEQPVLTANEYVYTGRRFFFMWGDWPCELTVPQDQTSYRNNCIRDRARINAKKDCNFFGDLTGFDAVISFPPRTIGELEARLHTMAQVGNRFVLDGLHVHSFLEFSDDHDHPDERIGGREGIHALWLALQGRKSTTAFFKFHDVKLSRLKIGFRFGHHYMPDDNLDLLYDDTFRTDLMLAHLRHYFGIPTAPINYYVPEPKEEVEEQEPQRGVGRHGTSLSLVSLAWDHLLAIGVMSGSKTIAFKANCDGMKVWIRVDSKACRWQIPGECSLGDVYDLIKRKAGLDLTSEDGPKKRQEGKFKQSFFLREINCTVQTYYDDRDHGESLEVTLSY